MALYGLNFGFRLATRELAAAFPFVLSWIAIALLSISGYLGGDLVYSNGIGVGRHRSHFDLSSGKVTQGPAKCDLKTFPARIERGKIQVALSQAVAQSLAQHHGGPNFK